MNRNEIIKHHHSGMPNSEDLRIEEATQRAWNNRSDPNSISIREGDREIFDYLKLSEIGGAKEQEIFPGK